MDKGKRRTRTKVVNSDKGVKGSKGNKSTKNPKALDDVVSKPTEDNPKPKKVEGKDTTTKSMGSKPKVKGSTKVKKGSDKKQDSNKQGKVKSDDGSNVKGNEDGVGGKKLFNVQWPGMLRKDSIEEIKIHWPSKAPQVVQDLGGSEDDKEDGVSPTEPMITKPKKRRAPTRVERLAKKREEELREQQIDPMQKQIKELGQPIAARRDLEGSNPIHLHNIVFTDKDIEYVVVVYKKEIRNILLQYEMFFSIDECPYNQMPKTSPYIVIGNDVYELQSFTSINYQDRPIK